MGDAEFRVADTSDDAGDAGRLATDLVVAASAFNRSIDHPPWDRAGTLWRTMAILDQLGPSRITTIAHRGRTTQPTASTAVARLEKEGWVERIHDPDDRRASLIAITEEGRKRLRELRRSAGERFATRMGHLSAQDRAALARAIAIMRELTPGT